MNTQEQINHRLNRAAEDVKNAGRSIWLAGLGVVGTVDERGRKVVSDLIERGRNVETSTDDLADLRPSHAIQRVKGMGDRIERRVEKTMTKTLNRLGVPARRDVETLSDRVATLTRQVEALRN